MELSSDQRRYLFFAQCVVPFVINFVLNGIIGIVAFRGVNPVPIWGVESSAGPDLIGTCFFLPAITCLIVTPLVRRNVRSGIVGRISLPAELPGWLRRFQRPLPSRAFFVGLAGIASAGALVAALLLAAGPAEFGHTAFLWLKASFSAALGGAVTPLIALVALAEGEQEARAA